MDADEVMAYARMVSLKTGEPLMSPEAARDLYELNLLIQEAKMRPEYQEARRRHEAVMDFLRPWHPVFMKVRELPADGPLDALLEASKRLYGDSGQASRADVDMIRLVAEGKAASSWAKAHGDSVPAA